MCTYVSKCKLDHLLPSPHKFLEVKITSITLYRYIYPGLFAMFLVQYILDIFFSVLMIILSYGIFSPFTLIKYSFFSPSFL